MLNKNKKVLATSPLIRKLNIECNLDRHMRYDEDCGAGATFDDLKKYFDLLNVLVPSTTKMYPSDEWSKLTIRKVKV